MRKVEQRLEELYAKMPKVACQGKCYDSCGPITMTVDEWRRLEEKGGRVPTTRKDDSCIFLTDQGRCSVYDVRPTICRLFGVTEGLVCPYGCVPEQLLSFEQGGQFLQRADKISGRKLPRSTGRISPSGIREVVEKILGDQEIE